MGFGGALIWSGLARNIKMRQPEKKIIFVYKLSWLDFLRGRKSGDNVIFENNSDIFLVIDSIRWFFKKFSFKRGEYFLCKIDLAPYAEKVYKGRTVYRVGAHAIELAVRDCGLAGEVLLRPKLVLKPEEIARVDKVLEEKNLAAGRFICLEPNTKKSFIVNKEWPWENWLELNNKLNDFIIREGLDVKVAQVGSKGTPVLSGVVDLVGLTSFREAQRILEKSLFLIVAEGGLAHLAASIPRKAIVLISALMPKEVLAYPTAINFYSEVECQHCGLSSIPCPHDLKCMKLITVDEVFAAAKAELLKLKKNES